MIFAIDNETMILAEKWCNTSSANLMFIAGNACAREIIYHYMMQPVIVLCGPGNNGGDGFIIAESLRVAGWNVKVLSELSKNASGSDARRLAFENWKGKTVDLTLENFIEFETGLTIDCLFGTGFKGGLKGEIEKIAIYTVERACRVVSIDIPSGTDGNSGMCYGNISFQAERTITFSAPKIGHFINPGKKCSGILSVKDIGVYVSPESGIPICSKHIFREFIKILTPKIDCHKYSRGHVFVNGGGSMSSGAARMSAQASLASGVGAVTITFPDEAINIYASHCTSIMLLPFSCCEKLDESLKKKNTSAVIGPGNGVNQITKDRVALFIASTNCVIDADALTVFAQDPNELFALIKESKYNIVLTPHYGEFAKIFPDLVNHSKVFATKEASLRSGATVLFKGNDSVISCASENKITIHDGKNPKLAVAGSGDVLSGIIGAFLALEIPPFESTCMATIIHSELSQQINFKAEDMICNIPIIIDRMVNEQNIIY